MHTRTLLENFVANNCPWMHGARRGALVKVVEGLMHGGTATLTHIGRSLRTGIDEKHNIKCVDRLVGNEHLWSQRHAVYGALCAAVLPRGTRPWVLLDWSDIEHGHRFVMLKAAVSLGGRTLTLYEEAHPLSRYANPQVERRFLERLAQVLPPGCRPVIVTDAGFRGPWFRAVEAMGWDWVGRVRNLVKCRRAQHREWCDVRELYPRASSRAQELGEHWLAKKSPYRCRLVLVRSRRRASRGARRRLPVHHTRAARRGRDPWLLATSLPCRDWPAGRIVQIYRRRMHIEETFRDLKNPRWGYGLEFARSRHCHRLENLLLVSTLATFATILVGLAARARRWTRRFQANTVSDRAVLSVFFLGRRVLKARHLPLGLHDLELALRNLPHLVHTQQLSP